LLSGDRRDADRPHQEAAMAEESKQAQDTEREDATQGEDTEATGDARGDKGGDDDKPGAALLKALQDERDARRKAEAALRKREQAERDAETQRAIKAGEWEAVANAKDGEIAERDARIAELEGEIASARLTVVRERVASKHRLPPELAELLRGDDEAALDAHAKTLAKVIVVKTGNAEPHANANGASAKQGVEELKAGMVKTGRYAF
jgi:hypothetical protein